MRHCVFTFQKLIVDILIETIIIKLEYFCAYLMHKNEDLVKDISLNIEKYFRIEKNIKKSIL